MIKNRKGMLANLVGGFVVMLIGVMIIPQVIQQMDTSLNCNSTNISSSLEQPLGKTDSFGGGGAGQFGGYDGKVHKTFGSNLALYQGNQSIFGCKSDATGASRTLLIIVSIVFALAIVTSAIGIIFFSIKNFGVI